MNTNEYCLKPYALEKFAKDGKNKMFQVPTPYLIFK